MKKLLLPILLITLILIINVFRLINLDGIPNGFMFDEETSAVTLQCLVEKGIAPLNDQPYPVFGDVGIGTPKPPTYMYPGMLWVKAFGFSPAAIRSYTVFSFMIALAGLFAIGWHLRGLLCGLWILLAASISPWTWTYTRVGWESPFILPFLVWGLFVSLRAQRTWQFILAGVLFSGAVYSYPPAKLQIPLLLVCLTIYGIKSLKWKISQVMVLGTAFLITSIPLIYYNLTDPSLSVRLNYVALNNPDNLRKAGKTGSFIDLASIVFNNFLIHLRPDFLFFSGTGRDLGVTTGRQGILSWVDSLALIAGSFWIIRAWLAKKTVATPPTLIWTAFLGVNIFIGILPSIVTTLFDPNCGNNLRSIGAWPFVMIATGMIIHKFASTWNWAWIPAFLTAALFAGVFLTQYFTLYAKESVRVFRKWSLEEARNAKTDKDWLTFLARHHKDGFATRYFLMRYHGDNCIQARTIWEKTSPAFEQMIQKNQQQ